MKGKSANDNDQNAATTRSDREKLEPTGNRGETENAGSTLDHGKPAIPLRSKCLVPTGEKCAGAIRLSGGMWGRKVGLTVEEMLRKVEFERE